MSRLKAITLSLSLMAMLLVPTTLMIVSAGQYDRDMCMNNENEFETVEYLNAVFENEQEQDDYFLDSKVPHKYQKIAYDMSIKYDIDFPLLVALIEVESGGKAKVISETDDYGLCQINICNHEWLKDKLNYKDILAPKDNIECGCYMLARYFRVYDRTSEVLMAYNLGGKEANKLIRQGIHETEYSRKIMEREKEMVEEKINEQNSSR